ncbi:hypothetical protein SNEBB_001343 [Seison nebaliae]|nr:hypothetical protein SNEBB_001343 [Seison nebaliae]
MAPTTATVPAANAASTTATASTGRAKKTTRKVVSRSSRANLIFPVARFKRLQKNIHRKRVGWNAAVYVTSVVEYLVAEMLELSGNAAKEMKKTRIQPRHFLLAVLCDEELRMLMKGVTVPQAGVLPSIHPALLGEKAAKAAAAATSTKKGGKR